MALWICTGCTARYSVGAPECPECGSTDHIEEGVEDMAKVTVHGGPSIGGADVDPVSGEVSPLAETDEAAPAEDPSATTDQPEQDADAQNTRSSRRGRKTNTE